MIDTQDVIIKPRRSRARRVVKGTLLTLISLFLLGVLAIILNAVLFRFFGGVQAWQDWRIGHYWHLLAWRLVLYTGLAITWFKLKTRLQEQDAKQSNKRLRKVEVLVVLLVLLIEVSKLAFQPGGVV